MGVQIINKDLLDFKNGVHIEEAVFSPDEIEALRNAFYEVLKKCEDLREEAGTKGGMDNTVHHVLMMKKVIQIMIEKPQNQRVIERFFGGKKYILNSLGGNNNTKKNYASNIHRDVRFYTADNLMLNSIWCISPLNENTGGTQFLLGSHLQEKAPSEEKFNNCAINIQAPEGSIVYFDSRIWHRAGNPIDGLKERIIYTPIYSRPFIKPGYDYSQALQKSPEFAGSSDFIKQICSYYSDVPKNHVEWYGFDKRRFYMKDQDL